MMRDAKQNDILLPWAHEAASKNVNHNFTHAHKGCPKWICFASDNFT